MGIPRVRILQLSAETLAALARGDLDAANATAPVPLTAYLVSDSTIWTWHYRARQVAEHPDDLPWVTGVVWDESSRETVGRAGFHGAPDDDGMVEVGYAIDPAWRRRGYARAALERLLDRAKSEPAIRTLRVSISPDNAPSLSLIRCYPFVEIGEQWDDEDGLEIIYEMPV